MRNMLPATPSVSVATSLPSRSLTLTSTEPPASLAVTLRLSQFCDSVGSISSEVIYDSGAASSQTVCQMPLEHVYQHIDGFFDCFPVICPCTPVLS